MKTEGFSFTLSDGSEILIAPKDGADLCLTSRDEFSIELNSLTGTFRTKSLAPRSAGLGIVEFKRATFEIEGETGESTDEGEAGVLGCRVSGGCCNCGSGWICG